MLNPTSQSRPTSFNCLNLKSRLSLTSLSNPAFPLYSLVRMAPVAAKRYLVSELEHLRQSPLAVRPTHLPPTEEWMGLVRISENVIKEIDIYTVLYQTLAKGKRQIGVRPMRRRPTIMSTENLPSKDIFLAILVIVSTMLVVGFLNL